MSSFQGCAQGQLFTTHLIFLLHGVVSVLRPLFVFVTSVQQLKTGDREALAIVSRVSTSVLVMVHDQRPFSIKPMDEKPALGC